jgi:hypothetical protein
MSADYTFPQVRRSLVGSICVLTLGTLAFAWNGVWLGIPADGLGFVFDDTWVRLPVANPMSNEGAATLLRGTNVLFAVIFLLLPLLCGLIGTYRGATKTRLPGPVVVGLMIPSVFPPLALVAQIALLVKVRKDEALADKFSLKRFEKPTTGPRWPWIGAAASMVLYSALQVQVQSSDSQLGAALVERREIWAEAKRRSDIALASAVQDTPWAHEDIARSLRAGDQALAFDSATSELIARRDRSAHLTNLAFLLLLVFALIWAVSDFLLSRSISKPETGGQARLPRVLKGAALGEAITEPSDGASACDYFLMRGDQRCGPYSLSVLRSLSGSETISSSDLCWKEGWTDWRHVSEVLESMEANSACEPMKLAKKWTLTRDTGTTEHERQS